MRTVGSNTFVIQQWHNGQIARNKRESLTTDGSDLFSYAMRIGRTVNGKKQLLLAYRYSATTTKHVQEAHTQRYGEVEYISPLRVNEARASKQDYWYIFPDEKMQYALYINTPGYLPDTEPAIFNDIDMLWSALLTEAENTLSWDWYESARFVTMYLENRKDEIITVAKSYSYDSGEKLPLVYSVGVYNHAI